jgi:ABC-type cobalamin/Fe3+-siderophores transport system ATPase subunit
MNAAVDIVDWRVRAGGRTRLTIDAWRVEPGIMVGVLGPNGAGKTTLLRGLLGMGGSARGRVRVLDQDLDTLGAGGLARLRRRIGYVPQHLPTDSEMPLTVREVVAMGRTGRAGLLRPLRPHDWARVDAWLDRLGLAPLAGRGFGAISGGEQRKTLIARAMTQEPELLLLDEPTANLDLGWRERIVEQIADLQRNTNLTTLLVCHELEVLPPCCRRVVLFREGAIAADGVPGEVLTPERIAALYGPGLTVLYRGGRWAVVPEGAADA